MKKGKSLLETHPEQNSTIAVPEVTPRASFTDKPSLNAENVPAADPELAKPPKKAKRTLTKREKTRIKYIPLMLPLLALAIGVFVLYEMQCSSTIALTLEIDLFWVALTWLRVCNLLVVIFMIFVIGGVILLKYPMPKWSFTFAAMIAITFLFSIFAAIHYDKEMRKSENPKVGLFRNETLPSFKIKDKLLGVGVTKDDFKKLENIQRKLSCCGLEGFKQYDSKWGDWERENQSVIEGNEKVPTSCCKKETKDCNKDAFNNPQNFHEDGCRQKVIDSLDQCLPYVWISAIHPCIVGSICCVIGYLFTRNVQGLPWTNCCEHVPPVPDPELDEVKEETEKRKSSSFRAIRKSLKEAVVKADEAPPPPVEQHHEPEAVTNSAVYKVVEHVEQNSKKRSSLKGTLNKSTAHNHTANVKPKQSTVLNKSH